MGIASLLLNALTVNHTVVTAHLQGMCPSKGFKILSCSLDLHFGVLHFETLAHENENACRKTGQQTAVTPHAPGAPG